MAIWNTASRNDGCNGYASRSLNHEGREVLRRVFEVGSNSISRFGFVSRMRRRSVTDFGPRFSIGVCYTDEPVLIRQGIEANRPSEIFVRASRNGDRLNNIRVGGYAVKVMEGVVTI